MEHVEIDTCKLLYNTERVILHIPEYGRNVQKMVNYLNTIEDRVERNRQARAVIKVMETINPAVHLQDNYEQKLWDHLHIISGFTLDVDSPYPAPAPESLNEKPLQVTYNDRPVKAAHYGRNIENLIDFIAEKEDGPEKTSMLRVLAGHMRQLYISWNKETVSDEAIFQDIERLSDYRIKIPEGMQMMKHGQDNSQRHNGQNNKSRNRQKNSGRNRKQKK